MLSHASPVRLITTPDPIPTFAMIVVLMALILTQEPSSANCACIAVLLARMGSLAIPVRLAFTSELDLPSAMRPAYQEHTPILVLSNAKTAPDTAPPVLLLLSALDAAQAISSVLMVPARPPARLAATLTLAPTNASYACWGVQLVAMGCLVSPVLPITITVRIVALATVTATRVPIPMPILNNARIACQVAPLVPMDLPAILVS
jgi:hypothetical protein